MTIKKAEVLGEKILKAFKEVLNMDGHPFCIKVNGLSFVAQNIEVYMPYLLLYHFVENTEPYYTLDLTEVENVEILYTLNTEFHKITIMKRG